MEGFPDCKLVPELGMLQWCYLGSIGHYMAVIALCGTIYNTVIQHCMAALFFACVILYGPVILMLYVSVMWMHSYGQPLVA